MYVSQTSLRGASKTAVMTISRSDGVLNVPLAPGLFVVAMTPFILFKVLWVRIQSLVARVPEAVLCRHAPGRWSPLRWLQLVGGQALSTRFHLVRKLRGLGVALLPLGSLNACSSP